MPDSATAAITSSTALIRNSIPCFRVWLSFTGRLLRVSATDEADIVRRHTAADHRGRSEMV